MLQFQIEVESAGKLKVEGTVEGVVVSLARWRTTYLFTYLLVRNEKSID